MQFSQAVGPQSTQPLTFYIRWIQLPQPVGHHRADCSVRDSADHLGGLLSILCAQKQACRDRLFNRSDAQLLKTLQETLLLGTLHPETSLMIQQLGQDITHLHPDHP